MFLTEGKDLGVFVFTLLHFRVKRCYQCRSLHLSVLICHETMHEQQTESVSTWVFPKIGVPQNGWLIMENPIKMDDLGLPLFSETSTYCWRLVVSTLYHLAWLVSPWKNKKAERCNGHSNFPGTNHIKKRLELNNVAGWKRNNIYQKQIAVWGSKSHPEFYEVHPPWK